MEVLVSMDLEVSMNAYAQTGTEERNVKQIYITVIIWKHLFVEDVRKVSETL